MNHVERLSRKANEYYKKWVKEQIKEKMTLQQVKDKYFPNRTIAELSNTDAKRNRILDKQDLEALSEDWKAVGDDFRTILGKENKMNEKVKCVQISFNDGDTLIIRVEDWKNIIDDIDALLRDGEDGDYFEIIIEERAEEELKNLPEFEGF